MSNRNINSELRKLANLPLIDRLEKINQLQISLYEIKKCCRKTLKKALGGYNLFKNDRDLILTVEKMKTCRRTWIFHISSIEDRRIYDKGFYPKSMSSKIDYKVYQLGTYQPDGSGKITGLFNYLATDPTENNLRKRI
jgi:hypothetical protein